MTNDGYRLHNGRIEIEMLGGGRWIPSAHDTATPDELASYEEEGHPVAPLLRKKFGLPDAG
jgi:hypothetical protein